MLDRYLNVHTEVQKSIYSRSPVIALDSSSLFNNIHYPRNIEVANNISKIIRNNGCIPATIAVINGVLKVGLTQEDIAVISMIKNLKIVNPSELPYVILNKLTGTTTLASSIKIASLSNIIMLSTNNIESISDIESIIYSNVSVVYNNISKNLDDINTMDYLYSKGVTIIDSKSYCSDKISNIIKIKSDLNLNRSTLISTDISSSNLSNEDSIIKTLYHNAELASKIASNLLTIKKHKFTH